MFVTQTFVYGSKNFCIWLYTKVRFIIWKKSLPPSKISRFMSVKWLYQSRNHKINVMCLHSKGISSKWNILFIKVLFSVQVSISDFRENPSPVNCFKKCLKKLTISKLPSYIDVNWKCSIARGFQSMIFTKSLKLLNSIG